MKNSISSALLPFVFLLVLLTGCAPAVPPTPESGLHDPVTGRDWLITVNSVVQSTEVNSSTGRAHPQADANTFVIVEFTALNLQSHAPAEFPEADHILNGIHFFKTSGAYPPNAFSLKDAVLRSADGVYPIAGFGVGGAGTAGTPIIVFAPDYSDFLVASPNSVEIYFFVYEMPLDIADQPLTFQFQELTTSPFIVSE